MISGRMGSCWISHPHSGNRLAAWTLHVSALCIAIHVPMTLLCIYIVLVSCNKRPIILALPFQRHPFVRYNRQSFSVREMSGLFEPEPNAILQQDATRIHSA